jgi:hypothetical protein
MDDIEKFSTTTEGFPSSHHVALKHQWHSKSMLDKTGIALPRKDLRLADKLLSSPEATWKSFILCQTL